MDEKLQELLSELAKELGGDVNVNTQPQTTTQTQQVAEQTQYYEEQEEDQADYDYQTQLAWENWKQYGRTAFISFGQGDPRTLKYMPLIEQRAEYKLQMDLAKNQMKDSYLEYLQEAYKEILKELAGIVKDFLPSRQVPYGYMGMQNAQETPTYTMKDYHNDYKKALEYATYKGMGEIYYKDSSEKGKYGEGKIRLGESLDELNI